MQISKKAKNILSILLRAFTWLVVAFTVFMMIFTIVTVSTVDQNDRSLFGVKFYIVRTGSMSKSENNKDMDIHFNAGDIVLIKNVDDPTALQEGDVIAFISRNSGSYGETVTHMIREVRYNTDGEVVGYVTFGTNTGTNDEKVVYPEYVIGKYTGKLPGLGHFFAFVKSTPGYIVCILVPFLLIILYNAVNFVRAFKKYKGEQTAKLQEERAEIEKERKQNEEILKELQALKEQLAKKDEEGKE